MVYNQKNAKSWKHLLHSGGLLDFRRMVNVEVITTSYRIALTIWKTQRGETCYMTVQF
jgi:hypothetical protein